MASCHHHLWVPPQLGLTNWSGFLEWHLPWTTGQSHLWPSHNVWGPEHKVSWLLVGGHWCQWTYLWEEWSQSAYHLHQRHHDSSPPVIFPSHVWSVYWPVHPVNLVPVAHSCVGDLPHLSVQGRSPSLEVCSLQVYPSLGFLWGHSIGFPLWGLGQICHPSPSGGLLKHHNFMNCANLTVLPRMKHPHGLVTVDFCDTYEIHGNFNYFQVFQLIRSMWPISYFLGHSAQGTSLGGSASRVYP